MNPPKIMVFRPTMEEFKDFSRYVHYMESQGAHLAGLAKIIPPKEWMPTKSYDNIDNFIIPAPIEQVVSGQKGLFTQYNIQRKPVTVKEFRRLTNTTRYEPPFHENYEELERVYWKNITFNSPIYGADISGSLYDKGVDEWNISRLNTLLDVIESDYGVKIEGVNTAYLYFGMWKTTFAWHTEDMDLYSINYVHFGAPKSWYAVPPEHGKRLERLAAGFYPNDKSMCSSFLRHKMTLISPSILRQYGIPVNKITQEAGEFMITFPYGYHSGFNHGFNCAESTNFASERWINYGKAAEKCTCKNDTVTIDMDVFVRLFQPDQYDIWKMKKHETKLPYGEIPQAPDMTLHYPTWMEKVEEYRKKHELSNFLKKKLLTPVPYKSPKSKLLHSQAHCSKSPHKTKKVKKSLSLSDSNHRLVKVSAEQIDARQLQKVDTESRVSCINEELVDIPVEFPNQCLFDRIKNGSRRKSSAKAISCEDDVERILNKHSIADAAWQPNHPSKKSHRARSLDSGNNPKTSNCSVQCEPLCTLPLEVISEVPLIVKESKHTVKRRHPVSGKSSKQTCPNILVKCGHNDDNAAEESSMCEIKHFKTEKASFKDERDYNENVARLPPHCAICSLFKPHYSTPQSDVSTQGGLPSPIPVAKDKPEFVAGDRTTPLIPEVSFASSVNSPSPLAECQLLDTDGKSQLIQCCVCCVQTHSSCYGIEKPPADGAPWTCNRCMERDWSAQCSLCCIRGGALKRIIGGNNWAHVVCAIAIPEVYFEQTVHRNNINVSRIPQKRLKLKCAYRKSNGCGGICLQCCSGRCTVSFHTTCAHAAGITIEPGNWPFPVYVHCHKHTMLRINGPQETQQKPVEIDRFVVAKHKNGNYYSALVRKFKKEDFYKVNFKDNSWSDNLYAQDIVSHDWSTGEPPVMGSAVQVKWTDGNVYEAEYRGHAEQETIQVEFDDALLVDFERHEIYTEEDPMPSKVRRKMRNQISFTRKAANY